MNKKAKIITSLLLGLVTLNGVVSTKLFAKKMIDGGVHNNNSPSAGVSCYMVGPSMPVAKFGKKDIEAQIKQLDTLYAEKKINSQTYNVRKKELQAKLKDIESRDDGVDVDSIEDLKLGLKRIRYQYKMKKLTPEMYNEKRKFYMERIKFLEDKGLQYIEKRRQAVDSKIQRLDSKIQMLDESYKLGNITKETYELKKQLYEQEKIYYQNNETIHIRDSELGEIRTLLSNKQIDYSEYMKRKLNLLKRLNASKQ